MDPESAYLYIYFWKCLSCLQRWVGGYWRKLWRVFQHIFLQLNRSFRETTNANVTNSLKLKNTTVQMKISFIWKKCQFHMYFWELRTFNFQFLLKSSNWSTRTSQSVIQKYYYDNNCKTLQLSFHVVNFFRSNSSF